MSHSNDNILAKVIDLTENYHFSVKRNIYRETLRQLLNIFGNIYYLDGSNTRTKVKCTTGKPDRPTGKDANENNLVLPYITISEIGSEEADGRRRVHNLLVNEKIWDVKENRAKRYLSLAPKAININYEINIWAKYNADLDQIRYSIFSLFHPSLEIRTNFSDFTKAFVKNESDISSPQAGDTTDRLIQKTISITVETYLPSPKFLYTNTGEIKSFNAEVTLVDTRASVTEEVEGTNVRVVEVDRTGGEAGPNRTLTLSGSLVDVDINSVTFGDVLVWNGDYWTASGLADLIGGENLNHQVLTNRGALDAHPQYASSSVSAYAFGLSSILASHIANSDIHFTSGSLSGAYVLTSTNSNLSSLVSNIQTSTVGLSSIVSSHINDSTIHFTSGSLSGAYVLTATNSALSSLVDNHIGSAVHWELSTLNTNYLNASGDSANAGFYLSSVSATDISATNYYNLPSATIPWKEAEDVILYVKNSTGQPINKGVPVAVNGADGTNPTIVPLSSVNNHVPEAIGFSNHVAGLTQEYFAVGALGHIVVEGILQGQGAGSDQLDTSNFNEGDWLYVSSNGQLNNVRPPAPYESHPVGIVLRKNQNNGKILVKIENVPEINDIVGFNLSPTLIDGDLITYVSSTNTFINKQSISLSGTIKAPTLSGTVVSAGTLHVGGSDGIIKNNNGDIIISATNGIVRFPYGLSAASVSTTTYSNLPSSTALWNANKLQGRDVLDQNPSMGQVLTWNINRWEPSTVSTGGGGVTDHGALTGLLDNDHPQYASSSVSAQINSVSAYASGVSSIVSSHINDSTIHFTSGSLSAYYAASSWTEGRYVLSSTNNNLSSLVSNIQVSANNISSVLGAHIASSDVHFTSGSLSGAYVLTSTNSNLSTTVSNLQASTASISSVVNSHINDSSIHFTSGSLSGYYAGSAWTDSRYVLTSTNSNLSSLVNNIQTSSNNLSGVVGAHIGSAVHWSLETLNTNYLNSSGDSAIASFYLSNLSAINFSATTYLNLPTSSLSGLADVSITNPTNGQSLIWSSTISRWVPSSVGGGGGSTAFGSNYQLQFYNGGSLSAVSNMTYNPTSQNLDVYKVNVTDSMYSPYYNGGFGSLNPTGLQANQVSATTYLNLPSGTALWNANKIQGVNVSSTAPNTSAVFVYNGAGWTPGYSLYVSGNAPNNSIGNTGDLYFQYGDDLVVSANTLSAANYLNLPTSSLSGLLDTSVTVGNIGTGKSLVWNGSKWIPSSITGGTGVSPAGSNYQFQFYKDGQLSAVQGIEYSPDLYSNPQFVLSGAVGRLYAETSIYTNALNLGNQLTVNQVAVTQQNSTTLKIASSLLLPSALIFGSGIPSTAQFPAGIYYTGQSAQNAPPAIYQCNQDNLNIYTNFAQGKAFRLVDQVAAAGGFAGSGYEFDGNSFIIQHGVNASATLVATANGVLQVQNTLSATTVSADNYFGLPAQIVAASAANIIVTAGSALPNGALIFTRTINGIVSGDTIEVEINGTFNNGSTGTIVPSGIVQLGTFSAIVGDGSNLGVTTSASYYMRAVFSVAASNSCALNVVQQRSSTASPGSANGIATTTYRHVYNTSTSINLIGSQTFNFRVASNPTTAPQTFSLYSYKITKIKSL